MKFEGRDVKKQYRKKERGGSMKLRKSKKFNTVESYANCICLYATCSCACDCNSSCSNENTFNSGAVSVITRVSNVDAEKVYTYQFMFG